MIPQTLFANEENRRIILEDSKEHNKILTATDVQMQRSKDGIENITSALESFGAGICIGKDNTIKLSLEDPKCLHNCIFELESFLNAPVPLHERYYLRNRCETRIFLCRWTVKENDLYERISFETICHDECVAVVKFHIPQLLFTLSLETPGKNLKYRDIETIRIDLEENMCVHMDASSNLYMTKDHTDCNKRHRVRKRVYGIGSALSKEEQIWQKARLSTVFTNLNQIPGIDLESVEHTPRIAVCFSGGGFPALVFGLGVALGLKSIGIYDSLMWSTGVSGGSWLQSILSESEDLRQTHDEIRENLHQMLYRLVQGIPTAICKTVQSFLSIDRPSKPNFFDLMGLVIAQALNLDHSKLSQEKDHIRDGRKHMPLYTASIVGEGTQLWFSPFRVAHDEKKMDIPSEKFGSRFENGVEAEEPSSSEQFLGLLFGLWGSAFAASVGEIARLTDEVQFPTFGLLPLARKLGVIDYFSQLRFLPTPTNHDFTETTEGLQLLDTGAVMNADPTPVLIPDRRADIVIIVDARCREPDNDSSKTCLEPFIDYATKHGIRLPKSMATKQFKSIGTRPVTTFPSHEQDTTSFVYLPLHPIEDAEGKYVPRGDFRTDIFMPFVDNPTFDRLIDVAQLNVIGAKKSIFSLIENHIDLRKQLQTDIKE